jgi:hypothetical protein
MKILSKLGLAGIVLAASVNLTSAQHSNLPSEFYGPHNVFTAKEPFHPLSIYRPSGTSQPATQKSSDISESLSKEQVEKLDNVWQTGMLSSVSTLLGLLALGGILSLGEYMIGRRRYRSEYRK